MTSVIGAPNATETRIVTKRLRDRPEDSWTLDGFTQSGGYEAFRAALKLDPEAIGAEQVAAAGLRGRGGAGFPTGTKWSFLPKDSYPRYLVVNGDEGEPSTFKDRMLIENDPHQLIEGIAISSYAIGCNLAFIYVRGEFALGFERLEAARRDAHAAGFLGANILGSGFDLDIVIHRAAGAYICGEETALLSSLEGDRGMPRIRPPFPAVAGLYAKPTIVNNVETLSTVPHIMRMGGAEYAKLGVNKSTGTRIFSLSGHVNRPGNYEVELGITFRDLIESPELGGGVRNGGKVKFFIPGGASSQWLTGSDEHLDAPLDMDYVQQTFGVMLGSGAVMVYDETTNPALVAWRLAKFFAHESCGKCTPCREGTGWIEKVLYRISHGYGRPQDLDLLLDVGDNISPGLNAPFSQTTICPLGPSAVSPVVSLHKFFREEVIAMCQNNDRALDVTASDSGASDLGAGE
ncbi:NADH dehydrogenase subunit F [Actinobacteria bacterium IMCC26256]|nr:NADH dehydrogenase subunit F [Actinobacteria bacterium IMCC26256]